MEMCGCSPMDVSTTSLDFIVVLVACRTDGTLMGLAYFRYFSIEKKEVLKKYPSNNFQ